MVKQSGLTRRQGLKYTVGIGGGAALAALLGSCSKANPNAKQDQSGPLGKGVSIRFFVGGDAGDAFASIVYNGAKAAAKDFGPDVNYVFSGWAVEKMQTQLRDAIAAKPDGIAMMGHAGDNALMPLAKNASDAGILMMYQNVDVPKVRSKFGGGYVGANNVNQGRDLGVAAVVQFGLKGGDEAIVFGAFGDPGRDVRELATADYFEEKGLKVQKIRGAAQTAADPNLLTPVVSAAFLRRPDTKIIVYPGGQNLGAVPQYMDAIGKKPGEIANIGFDLSSAVIQAFNSGYVQLTADQQPYLQGYLPILSLVLTKKYGFAPLNVDTGSGFVTKENYKSVAELAKGGIR